MTNNHVINVRIISGKGLFEHMLQQYKKVKEMKKQKLIKEDKNLKEN